MGCWVVRGYGEKVGDYQMVSGWMEGRGMGMLLENLLPPTGIVLECDGEAVGAAWLYLCYGIGVAFWEGLVARPGLSMKEMREMLRHCTGALRAIAAENDVGVIKVYAQGVLADEGVKCGLVRTGENYVSLITTTT